ncbi:MAG TPA: phytanoyl-CoA dioxygenase family protein [Acidimicrobiales bacterium]|nr:phytanoyl-CoA dioxygenase family protein [Acidimicrobiales bacterium]
MVSVDFRTRSDNDEVGAVDAAAFFGDELPKLIADRGDLAVPGTAELSPRPLAIQVGDASWTLSFADNSLSVATGDDEAVAVVVLDDEGLTDLVHDIRTPMGFFTGGDLTMPRGRLEDFLDWGVILRSLIDARAVHTPGDITFDDLDLNRAFQPDDTAADKADFLGQAGFLHLANVFTEDEMAAVSADIDAATPAYSPDDGRSWWAKTKDGEHRAVRLQYFQEHSPTTRDLLDDERFLGIGRLTSDDHAIGEAHLGWNVIEALVKPLGVVEGISDLPWHKDCSLGRHSYRCCSLTVGISVTGADANSGQLRVVAGSHRALIQPAFVRRNLDLPQVDLPTSTGDVTVHLSCTMHMSQAPVDQERRVMYTGFRLPEDTSRSDTASANEAKLRRIREGAYKTVSQAPAR